VSNGAKLSQGSRLAVLKTPLGKDELVLTRFEASEALSEPFEYTVEALSETEDVDFNAALGSDCCVSIESYNGSQRRFNGVLVEARWLGLKETYYCYQLVLRPWFWLLTRTSDCRIFANKTALDIVQEVFGEHDFAKYDNRTSENCHTREYTVQYRESDFNFVSRLLEEEGISYFFEHSEDSHVLVLADAKSSYSPLNGGPIMFRPLAARERRNEENFSEWVPGRRFNTGKVSLKDYDYLKPSNALLSEKDASASYANSTLEGFDYPGRYTEKSVGDKYARVRIEAEQASDERCQAAGDAVSLFPGALMDFGNHPNGSQNREYLVLQAHHTYRSEHYRSVSRSEAEEYQGRYECLPSDKPFRCPMRTAKPVVRGPQTAKVIGEGDCEIDVDEYGRIICQFHWDRTKDESRRVRDARRVRVAQVWAGNRWGGIFIPRVGMEVVVDFLEGDPDQPLVIGTVYNDDNMPPYELPEKKNIAGWKSDTTEGSGGYNEIVFDDTKDCELIRTHAQKDQEETVENDRHITVNNDHYEYVGNTMTVEAGELMTLIVGESSIELTRQSITIKSPLITIQAGMFLDATAPTTTVNGDVTLTLTGGMVLIN
jgi:type VI secretion system secreted protein VgrG